MSEKTAKQKRKEEEVSWCDKCHAQICPCVIEQVRNMESAMIVAKQAIESLDAMLHKKILDFEEMVKRNEDLTDKLKGKTQGIINDRMKEIDSHVSRFSLRNKIAVH